MSNENYIEHHKWKMLENIGSPRNPIMIKLQCTTCSCTFWYACGVKLFDPGGFEAPPCTQLDTEPLNS